MSYEAWGDDDDGLDGVRDHYRKHLIEDGWLDEEQAAVLQLRIQDLERELAAMTARAEAAERDAERYRWLRHFRWGSVVFVICADQFRGDVRLNDEELDAAIDAAIAKEQP